MQRRAAAVYFTLFVVLAAGAYGFMQVGTSTPDVDLDGPTYTEGETLTVNGTTYTVTTVEAGSGGDLTGELTWMNESFVETAALENGSEVPFRDGNYTVQIPNGTNLTSFDLVEQRNISAILAADEDVADRVTGEDGQEYVRFQNGSTQPLSEYLDPADSAEFSVGDEFDYAEANATTTVDAVAPEEVTLAWQNPSNQTLEFGEGENVTVGGQLYFGHFPDNDTVQVLPSSEYYDQYQNTLSDIDYYETRQMGLWGIIILSFLTAIVLMATAYLPTK